MSPIQRLRYQIHRSLLDLSLMFYRRVWGMHIGEGTRISFKASLDTTNPRGVYIGKYCWITFYSVILTHDSVNNRRVDTYIGDGCFVGAAAIINPGVRIGDSCIIAAGAVVVNDVPSGCVVAGNPARVIERGIAPGKYGVRIDKFPPESVAPWMRL